MRWYSCLYVGERAKKKEKTIIRKLKTGAGMLDVWLVTEAANGVDLFDIVPSLWLKQPAVRKKLPPIIGIARGYEEAVGLVRRIVDETYDQTGAFDIRGYLAGKK